MRVGGESRIRKSTYATLDVPGDDDLRGGDAQRTGDLLDLRHVERVLDHRAATEGGVRLEEHAVVFSPLQTPAR